MKKQVCQITASQIIFVLFLSFFIPGCGGGVVTVPYQIPSGVSQDFAADLLYDILEGVFIQTQISIDEGQMPLDWQEFKLHQLEVTPERLKVKYTTITRSLTIDEPWENIRFIRYLYSLGIVIFVEGSDPVNDGINANPGYMLKFKKDWLDKNGEYKDTIHLTKEQKDEVKDYLIMEIQSLRKLGASPAKNDNAIRFD